MFTSVFALVALATSVTAHATFQQLWINDVDAGSSCVRAPANNNPVTNVNSADIACNAGAASSSGVCPIKPGDKVTVEMHQHASRACSEEAIGGAHYGPVIVYMAAVSDAKTAVGSSANWFKVSQMGLMSNNPDYFGSQVLNVNCGHYTFTVPDIAPGNYLIRAEVIALHSAGGSGGAQFYPACFQVNVSGSGTAKPPTVRLPGAYSANDPGILINIYQDLTTYVIPGPTPYGEAIRPIATTKYPTTATWNTALQPTTIPTNVPGVTTTAGGGGGGSTTATATTTASGAQQTRYGQCGGTGWTGPTVCVSPSVCTAVSPPYYYQCV